MSALLRAKFGYKKTLYYVNESLSSSCLLRKLRSFSDGGDSSYPPEPIPNRPLRDESRKRQAYPSPNTRFPKFNRVGENGNPSSVRSEGDNFLERFKLGFDEKIGNTKGVSGEDNVSSNNEKIENVEPISPPEDADEIFKKMKETGLIPNAVAMLDGLCKDGLVQEAMKLFGLMREKGTIPEVVVYTAVVEGFCKAQKFEDAVRIFKKMQSNGVVPNAFSYGILIQGLCKGKREKGLEEAQMVIGAMRQKGFFIDEKAVREYLEKKGPFLPLVWEAILGKKASKKSLF
ncbi:Pentatricopeptide repeat-containing protein [Forsythia ovata]|uniref:Pentatricopeptide repeat-containing protein n=1 Tax=Forsythia ovata TaxID=205694 RepID=A0ABD1RNA4_9LAMI